MTDLKLLRNLASVPTPGDGENKSMAIIGYAFVGVIDFLFGLAVGWLIWG